MGGRSPTLLDLVGAEVPDHLEGASKLPVLEGDQTLEGNEVFIQWNGLSDVREERDLGSALINRLIRMPWRSVVTDGWKLNLCATDQCELFNVNTDPYEQVNLFHDPAQSDRIRDMTSRIRAWQHTTGDTAPLPSV